MLQQQTEVHLIKTCIHLKKVNISVRFPCSISFALKHQNAIIEHKGIHQLRKGECLINQPIEMQLQLLSRRGTYDEKKISLLIYMISANGKIPAGSVTISPTERIIADRRAPLQKCPDKNAEATYTQNFQILEVVSKMVNLPRMTIGSLSQIGTDFLGSKIRYSSSSKNLFLTEEMDQPQESVRTETEGENNLYSSKNQRSSKDFRLSEMGGKQYERKASRGRLTRFEQLSKKSVATIERDSRGSCQLKASRVSSQLMQAQDDQVLNQKTKIVKLQQDKANYIKKLAKIRDSLVRIDSQQRLQLQEQIEKAKYDNEVLQDEMQSLKERTKYQQRRQRESHSTMKELKDELDKKKSRILQLDSSRVKIESELSEKDKVVYQLQSQKKRLQDQLEEEKSLVLSSQKRLELKENSYKQQLKKLNEKYSQSESERQKAVLDYNNILAQIQTSEKKNQLLLRQKEKSSIEEKARLSKKIQQLNSELSASNQKILQLKTTVQEHQQFKKKMTENYNQKEYKINRLNEENQLLLNEIRFSEENYKKVLQEKVNLQEMFKEDKVNYKKKYNESLNQATSLKEKLQKALKNNANVEARILQLQNQMQLQIKDKNGLIAKLQEYKKQVTKFLNQEETRDRIAETFSIQNIQQTHKISEFKAKLDAERKRFEQMENQYEDQVQYLVKSKEMIQNQIEEVRWILQKEVQKFQMVSAKNKELNDEIIELSHKVIHFEEKEASHIQQAQSNQQLINNLNYQVQSLTQKLKTTADKLKEKEEQCHMSQKKVENLKQQLYNLSENAQKMSKSLAQKTQMLQKVQQQGQTKLKQKENELILLSDELYNSKEMINRLKQQIQMKTNELQMIKESYKTINADYSSLISKSDHIRQQEKRKDTIIQELQFAINQEKSQKQAFKREVQRKTMSFQEYRINTTKSLQQFFSLLNSQEADSRKQSSILRTLPQENLSLLQIQSLKKRNLLISMKQEQISELTNKIRSFLAQQKRQERFISELQEHHSNLIKKEQERYRLLSEQNVRQFNEFTQKMHNLAKTQDERSNQIQYFNSESKRYDALIQQLNQIITKLRTDQHQLKKEVVKLENEVFSYKQREIKEKLMCNTEADQLKHILQLEQQRIKELSDIHKEDLKVKDKLILEKVEEIKKVVARQEQWKMELRKSSDRINQLQKKCQSEVALRQNIEKQLRQKELKLKTLQQQTSGFKFKIQQLKIREITLEQQSKKSKAEIELLQQKHKTNRSDLQNRYQLAVESEKRQREKRQKVESSRAKIEQENKETREKCVKLESQVQFYKFYKLESAKKIEQHEKYKNETMTQLIKYRESSLKSEKEIGSYENKYYKMQVEMQSIIKQKSILLEDNSFLKEKMKEQEQRLMDYQSATAQLDSKEKQIVRLNNLIKSNEQQYQKMNIDLKASLAKSKQALGQKVSKIKQLQKFMEQKYNDITDERMKWQKQQQNEKNMMHQRIAQLEDKYQMIQQQFEFQKLQAIREIESSNSIIQELNEVIRDKEEAIQHKDEIINEQIVRLEELNIQLNECVSKWETEKESYLPTQTKMAEINEELTRMNKFISDLDGRNKQLLQINKRKMQQNIVSRPSITEQLKDVYLLLQKNKNRILNRCQTEKEKEVVISEFKAVQEKLDLTLKSTQIVNKA